MTHAPQKPHHPDNIPAFLDKVLKPTLKPRTDGDNPGMLADQAIALDTLFYKTLEISTGQFKNTLDHYTAALKMQNQCRQALLARHALQKPEKIPKT